MKVSDQSYGIIPLKQKSGVWFILLIRHLSGHWAFPKGHPESGETDREAAERELEEESGLRVCRYLAEDKLTEHYRFRHKGQVINKAVTYYIAEVEGEVTLQIEEVVDFKWVPLASASAHLTFPEARRMCQETFDRLH